MRTFDQERTHDGMALGSLAYDRRLVLETLPERPKLRPQGLEPCQPGLRHKEVGVCPSVIPSLGDGVHRCCQQTLGFLSLTLCRNGLGLDGERLSLQIGEASRFGNVATPFPQPCTPRRIAPGQ